MWGAPWRGSGGGAQAALTGSSVNPSRRAIGSIVNPWTRVETRTTKNAMLKNSILRGTFSITGKVARTTGTAPRNPAQPNRSRSVAVCYPIGPLRRFSAFGEERIILASALMRHVRKHIHAQRLRLSTCKTGALPLSYGPQRYYI